MALAALLSSTINISRYRPYLTRKWSEMQAIWSATEVLGNVAATVTGNRSKDYQQSMPSPVSVPLSPDEALVRLVPYLILHCQKIPDPICAYILSLFLLYRLRCHDLHQHAIIFMPLFCREKSTPRTIFCQAKSICPFTRMIVFLPTHLPGKCCACRSLKKDIGIQ